ncbi:unnamed protein product [Darwinula stevensoni]|uniref:Vacuolar protein sorting-associated protein 72 homolog n=1 Tax=Darwinula stevensoni TaxID=69355 RepID=A0A7R8X746_9CRUS|nr:unnamed protein product [Darwinula stevensoni]CAG0886556.1 unnamed protein product [Darwinula stevensoni]
MSLASTRERRAKAGHRMASLLNEEEEEDFYKTTYGGFMEEEGDRDYQSEDSEEDVVDSDFDIDEDDEVISDNEGEQGKEKKRRSGVITKAYKEPKQKATTKQPAERKFQRTKAKAKGAKLTWASSSPPKRQIRKSTQAKSAEVARRQQLRAEMKQQKKHTKPVYRHLTQEELLEEAKETERENLKSLEKYQLMELEKKKVRNVKKMERVPCIRYHSTTMPLIEEIDGTDSGKKYSRTFISFPNDANFLSNFSRVKRKYPPKIICPITRKPAKYRDPVTGVAYHNIRAFKVIRAAYYEELRRLGDRSNPRVKAWLDYWSNVREKPLLSVQ